MRARGRKGSKGRRLGEAAGDGGSEALCGCERGPEEDGWPHETAKERERHGGGDVGDDAARCRKAGGSADALAWHSGLCSGPSSLSALNSFAYRNPHILPLSFVNNDRE